MIENLWSKTYQCRYVPGLSEVSVTTAINGDKARNLVADLEITSAAHNTTSRVRVAMTPAQMRDLAFILTQTARRVEDDLLPLLEREPDIMTFTLDPVAVAA